MNPVDGGATDGRGARGEGLSARVDPDREEGRGGEEGRTTRVSEGERAGREMACYEINLFTKCRMKNNEV